MNLVLLLRQRRDGVGAETKLASESTANPWQRCGRKQNVQANRRLTLGNDVVFSVSLQVWDQQNLRLVVVEVVVPPRSPTFAN